MNTPKAVDPNDFKVVEFFNRTDFDFTPELGCRYDGRPLFVGSGERRQYPYHVGKRLSVNLAKAVLLKGAPIHDPNTNNPVGTPLWNDDKLNQLANSFITELYTDQISAPQSQTDILMARVAELEKLFVQKKEPVQSVETIVTQPVTVPSAPVVTEPVTTPTIAPKVYQDKQEVLEELDKREIKHDKRKSKEDLEKLLA